MKTFLLSFWLSLSTFASAQVGFRGLLFVATLTTAEAALPTGTVVMFSGSLTNFNASGLGLGILDGWALCNGTNSRPDLRNLFVKGWTQDVNPGTTGGSTNYTPSGNISTPTFTGDALVTHTHTLTPSGTNSSPTFIGQNNQTTSSDSAGTPNGSIAWPSTFPTNSAPTFTGDAFTSVINHIHAATVLDPGHWHTQAVNSATTGSPSGYTPDASTSGWSASGYVTSTNVTSITVTNANPVGGVSSITPSGTISRPAITNWPTSTPTFSGSALSSHAHTLTPSGTNSAPTFTGQNNQVSSATSGGTPSGTVSTPTFTGTAQLIEPPFYQLAFIIKL